MSLIAKLKFKEELPLVLINAPAEVITLFAELNAANLRKEAMQVMLFVQNKKALDIAYAKIISKLADNAVFWIAYPKKTSGIPSDLIRDEGWDVVADSDYRIVSSVSIDDNWSALRISKKKDPVEYKSSVPMEARVTEGVDYINRSVTLPADALAAMKPYKGLSDFFYSMSFSHTREYMEAIAEAKKLETRQRRIEKMIEQVAQLKSVKENKKK